MCHLVARNLTLDRYYSSNSHFIQSDRSRIFLMHCHNKILTKTKNLMIILMDYSVTASDPRTGVVGVSFLANIRQIRKWKVIIGVSKEKIIWNGPFTFKPQVINHL